MKKNKIPDLTGEKFDSWTVIELAKKDKNYVKYWLCKCVCGTESLIRSHDLIKNKSKRCKKCKDKITSKKLCKDLTGMTIGKWKIIKRVGTTKYRRPIWLCICKCGKHGKIPSSNLITGLSQCCGKCNHYKKIKGRVWSCILNSATRRGIKVSITIKDAWQIVEKQKEK